MAGDPRQIVKNLEELDGQARFEYAHEIFDKYIALSVNAGGPGLGMGTENYWGYFFDTLVKEHTFDIDFMLPEYSSFLIDGIQKLMSLFRKSNYEEDVGWPIERVLWAMGNASLQTQEFSLFCSEFSSVIEDYILRSDVGCLSHVILPMSKNGNAVFGDMKESVAATLLRRTEKAGSYDELFPRIGYATGTVPIDDFIEFLGKIRNRDERFFQAILGCHMMLDPLAVSSAEFYIMMIGRVEQATRNWLKR